MMESRDEGSWGLSVLRMIREEDGNRREEGEINKRCWESTGVLKLLPHILGENNHKSQYGNFRINHFRLFLVRLSLGHGLVSAE
jgi:hypothetical protein